jgi:hypothetical protein
MQIGICVLLLLVANGAPVLANDILERRWACAVDGGRCFFDGRPWLGPSKTWRGIVTAVVATALAAWIVGLGWAVGAALGGLAMVGDLAASFVKRRLAIAVSGRAWLLDQLPEAAVPLFLLRPSLGLSLTEVVVAVGVFTLLDILLSPLLYRLRLRQRPY